jgi:hypothetical protein
MILTLAFFDGGPLQGQTKHVEIRRPNNNNDVTRILAEVLDQEVPRFPLGYYAPKEEPRSTPSSDTMLWYFYWRATGLTREAIVAAIGAELDHAYTKHGREPWGRHEFYGVLLEEVDELWTAIKADVSQEEVLAELVQVAAMCFRYMETGDRTRGHHPALPSR